MKKDQKNRAHRGNILQAAAIASGLTIEVIVGRMKYTSRNTYYNHIKQEDLSLAILSRYGKVLRYDFGEEIEELKSLVIQEEETGYLKSPSGIEEATNQRDFYHKMYMELLEKVRSLEAELSLLRGQQQGGNKK